MDKFVVKISRNHHHVTSIYRVNQQEVFYMAFVMPPPLFTSVWTQTLLVLLRRRQECHPSASKPFHGSSYFPDRLLLHMFEVPREVFDVCIGSCVTDSTVALFWIKGEGKQWKQFVSNRVVEIRQLIPTCPWMHFAGKNNPADMPFHHRNYLQVLYGGMDSTGYLSLYQHN